MESSPPSASASCRESSTIGLDRNLDYYSEFLDVTRFPDPAYQIAFADFLRLKYRGVGLDLVVALQDVAVQFVNRNRESLFGTTPEVFLSNDPAAPIGPNATGLIHERDFAGTLALIERLQPDVKNVFVVVGAAASDKVYERAMRIQAQSFEPRLSVTYLSGLSTDELEQRLASLPDHSAVYHLLVTEDGAGHKYPPPGVREPRRGGRQRPDLFLGRLRDGSRHRGRQSLQPDGSD